MIGEKERAEWNLEGNVLMKRMKKTCVKEVQREKVHEYVGR